MRGSLGLASMFPKIGPLMDDAKTEVLAFTGFPRATGFEVILGVGRRC